MSEAADSAKHNDVRLFLGIALAFACICGIGGWVLFASLNRQAKTSVIQPDRARPAIQNQIDRFSIAIDVIDRVPSLQRIGAHAKEKLRNMQIDCQKYAYEFGTDKPEIDNWTWPY